jgi:hypothetical protein
VSSGSPANKWRRPGEEPWKPTALWCEEFHVRVFELRGEILGVQVVIKLQKVIDDLSFEREIFGRCGP